MPLELGSALSIEREPVNDPEIRVQTLEAIYLLSLQVKSIELYLHILFFYDFSFFLLTCLPPDGRNG